MPAVGNDIVDLNHPAAHGKSADQRFLKRVFTAAEQQAIRTAANPDRMLWSFWAAKESAYKIVSRLDSPPPFAHRRFACERWTKGTLMFLLQVRCLRSTQGTAQQGAPLRVNLCVETDAHCVHSYSAADGHGPSTAWIMAGKQRMNYPPGPIGGETLAAFSAAERASIHTRESATVRIACKNALAERLNTDIGRLQIIRPTRDQRPQPPYLLIDGSPADIGISLSHHGQWLAWCCSGPRITHGALAIGAKTA